MKEEMFTYYKNAVVDNLCQEYKGYWQRAQGNKAELLSLAMRQQSIPHWVTYAYEGRGLTKEYVLREFGNYVNGKYIVGGADGVDGYTYGMYVAFEGICEQSNDVSTFVWCDSAQVEVNPTKCPILYVACNSKIHITLKGYNNVTIYLFDESKVTIDEADETCNVFVYRYSDKAQAIQGRHCSCNKFRIFDKELRLQ